MAGKKPIAMMPSVFQNDFNAKVQADHSRTSSPAVSLVQPLYIDGPHEIERLQCKDLHLKLLCLPTHFLNKQGVAVNR